MNTQEYIQLEEEYGAHNYHPLDVVLTKGEGVWVIGLDGSPQATSPSQTRLDGSVAFVVGSEGQGMRPLVKKTCDLLMKLPMRGQVGSLNAAVAGSVALYLAWQARGNLGNST